MKTKSFNDTAYILYWNYKLQAHIVDDVVVIIAVVDDDDVFESVNEYMIWFHSMRELIP